MFLFGVWLEHHSPTYSSNKKPTDRHATGGDQHDTVGRAHSQMYKQRDSAGGNQWDPALTNLCGSSRQQIPRLELYYFKLNVLVREEVKTSHFLFHPILFRLFFFSNVSVILIHRHESNSSQTEFIDFKPTYVETRVLFFFIYILTEIIILNSIQPSDEKQQ